MEYWNLYDYEGKKKKKIALRGSKLNDNEYHLVVNAWIKNSNNEYLITQRVATKSHPLKWECTGGSALLGETSLEAAIREIREELGINVSTDSAKHVGRCRRYYASCPDIFDVWIFYSDVKLEEVTIQEEEVNDVKWATREEILKLYKENKFEPNTFFEKVINFESDEQRYYIGFNANNAICNESYFNGSITINPNHEKGNIYYSNRIVKKRDAAFLDEYKGFIKNQVAKICKNDSNVKYFAFNKNVKQLLDNLKINVDSRADFELIDKLNDKKFIRNYLKKYIPIIDAIFIDHKISYEEACKKVNSHEMVIQGKVGAGGNNTFFVDCEEKFQRYTNSVNHNYFLSKYVVHIPINSTLIITESGKVKLPSSVQLIKLEDDKFKYVGADFIYYDKLSYQVKIKIDEYTQIIKEQLQKLGYRGIAGIDFIIDENEDVYFMEINPRFQASSFIINQYLKLYCDTCLAELHSMATNGNYIGNIYLEKIEKSFLNCSDKDDYSIFSNYKIVKNGYFKKNKESCFRKVYNYSILSSGFFQKRNND